MTIIPTAEAKLPKCIPLRGEYNLDSFLFLSLFGEDFTRLHFSRRAGVSPEVGIDGARTLVQLNGTGGSRSSPYPSNLGFRRPGRYLGPSFLPPLAVGP